MTWDLSGADTSGGIHIHDGTSCASCSATTSNCGHYFDSAITHGVDPWGASAYTSASGSGQPIVTGLNATAILGKVVVVHDSRGVRIGCGLIETCPATFPGCHDRPVDACHIAGGGGSSCAAVVLAQAYQNCPEVCNECDTTKRGCLTLSDEFMGRSDAPAPLPRTASPWLVCPLASSRSRDF